MNLSVNQKRKLKQTRSLLIIGTMLGPIYIVFSDGFHNIIPFVNATIGAFLISCVIALLEIWLLEKGIRKLRFITLLFIRTIIYIVFITVIIVNVLVISRMIVNNNSYSDVLNSQEFQNYIYHEDFIILLIYSVVFALTINFTRMLSRKMGQGMLLSHIVGTYFEPVKQERIFMFLNVSNSKKISEKLGPLEFHKFLNNFIYDITGPIIHHGGIIYEYIEDLVVISWSIKKGIFEANCLRLFFAIQDEIEGIKEDYYISYGFSPQIKASIHCGNVIRAEIGDIKTQIVFHGDVMNTTSRILGKCYEMEKTFLASAHLIYRIEIPGIIESKSVGAISLKGKEKEVELFSIEEKQVNTVV